MPHNDTPFDDLPLGAVLRPTDIADRLLVDPRSVRRAISRGELRASRACGIRVLAGDAAEWWRSRAVATRTTVAPPSPPFVPTTSAPAARARAARARRAPLQPQPRGARSHFPHVVTTHTWEERRATIDLVRERGMEVCCGCIIGMGETLEQRAGLAVQLAAVDPHEVPMNFLDARPGTPFADLPPVAPADALRAVAAFRLAMPRTVLRFAGGRELTLGDLGARQGILGGINAVIVGNYLTTLGRDPQEDLDLLAELSMPVKALSQTL